MNPLIMPAIKLVTDLIDKVLPDKEKANELKAQITLEALKADSSELEAATKIIVAEASGECWLQRNWRPMLMLWFAGLLGAHWLGFTPDNLGEETILKLLDIVQVGIGGYVLGSYNEKMVKAYKGGKL